MGALPRELGPELPISQKRGVCLAPAETRNVAFQSRTPGFNRLHLRFFSGIQRCLVKPPQVMGSFSRSLASSSLGKGVGQEGGALQGCTVGWSEGILWMHLLEGVVEHNCVYVCESGHT